MPGLSDYSAENLMAHLTGRVPMPAAASVFLALFTTAPTSNAGTGGTEVSGGSYARVQVAGQLAASASWTTSVSTITMGSTIPAWVVAGMNVYDTTNSQNIGTVSSGAGTTTLTLTANASHASSGSTDNLAFSAFGAPAASSGTEPAVTPANITNGAVITFAQSTASWGTVTSFGLYDASTSGNLLWWDYLGNNKWIPFTCTNASPGVFTTDVSGDVPANSSSVVVTSKDGGSLPSTAGSFAGLLTTAGSSGVTFNVGVNTTSTGAGLFRQVATQSIPNNVTASFAASAFTLTAA